MHYRVSACHPCREIHLLSADALRSYCCLLLPRGSHKSCKVNEKTGRGGGDRTHDLRLKRVRATNNIPMSASGKLGAALPQMRCVVLPCRRNNEEQWWDVIGSQSLSSLFFDTANEIDVLNAPITIPSPAGADEDMLTESGILSLSSPNSTTR
jgi:hypothetical protein